MSRAQCAAYLMQHGASYKPAADALIDVLVELHRAAQVARVGAKNSPEIPNDAGPFVGQARGLAVVQAAEMRDGAGPSRRCVWFSGRTRDSKAPARLGELRGSVHAGAATTPHLTLKRR